MTEPGQPKEPRASHRSPLLLAAYCTLGLALIFMVVGAGLLWVLGASAMAILLGLGELVRQLTRR